MSSGGPVRPGSGDVRRFASGQDRPGEGENKIGGAGQQECTHKGAEAGGHREKDGQDRTEQDRLGGALNGVRQVKRFSTKKNGLQRFAG